MLLRRTPGGMPAPPVIATRRLPARFLQLLPAFVLAFFCLRIAELAAGSEAGVTRVEFAELAASALAVDAINLARYLPLLFLYSLPFLLIRSPRLNLLGLGLAWSLLLLLQAGLLEFSLTARLPLGADLFAYSADDVGDTISGGLAWHGAVIAGLVLGLTGLWLTLRSRSRWPPELSTWASLAIFALSLLILAVAPARSDFSRVENEDLRNLKLSKLSYFVDDNLLYLADAPAPSTPSATTLSAAADSPVEATAFRYLDPDYPFLHAEQTPDVLGPHFLVESGPPPNLVFVLVEGLGRSFSGPGASLGSFTPKLDALGERSLYWENFLAVQGRTFAVLPSLFGSLPFGDNGFAKLGERMPAHDSLLSVLKANGYQLRFYCGFDSRFDNERVFMQRQGIDVLVDKFNFGAKYQPANSWGFGDSELVSRVLDSEWRNPRQPFVSVISTVTMHTPYTFAGQSAYAARFERRLAELDIPESRRNNYRAHRDIYTSIMYADDALDRFFEQAKQLPSYRNTIFIVLGDHRLPEIPMATRIERYHVPMIITSPLLKAPLRIKSVSSQFDVAPSLLAFLAHNYAVKTPAAVTWIGSGLDTEPTFRNIHRFPLKQTKTNLVDFVSGTWFINRDQLYTLSDGMNIEPSDDATAMLAVQAQFARFRVDNDRFARSLALLPGNRSAALAEYRAQDRAQLPAAAAIGEATISVRDVHAPPSARQGPIAVEAVFDNSGAAPSETFVPIVVLVAADGTELAESYGAPLRLLAGERMTIRLEIKAQGVPSGEYFLAVMATHPTTGKRLGVGRHHIPIHVDG
jgi:uncharacterized sulfatase